ncbi:MAG: hypothetical protein Q8K98_07910 [Bacteroidota bacterium]|nr:hypothetical protein [Bacteroidota bacterium]
METLLTFVQIIALLCVSILSIYLIFAIKKITSSFCNIEKDINQITSKATPVFENLSKTAQRIDQVTENIEKQIDGVIYSINSIKKIADDVVAFEQRIQRRIEEPVLDAVSFFGAIVKGVRAFIERLKN